MKTEHTTATIRRAAFMLFFLAMGIRPSTILAQGTAFTYQGRLQDSGSPAGGTYNLTFSLYTNSAGGTAGAGPVTNNAVNVTNGLFTVIIDFGSGVWNGATNWLQIGVETNGGGGVFTTLNPRQELTPTPYAIAAENLNGTVGASGLSGTYGGAVNFTNPANSFTGSGAGLTNVNATTVGGLTAGSFWQTSGNLGTSPTNGNFLGTIDIQPLELRAGGLRALRLEPDPRPVPETANIIGGFTNNFIQQPGSGGDVIVGGGYDGGVNVVLSNSAGVFIGAGSANHIGPNVNDSAIVAGYGNTIGEYDGFIGGGVSNTIHSAADHSVIGGGWNNTIVGSESLYVSGAIGGGYGNTIQTNVAFGFIGGGYENTIQSPDSVIIGGASGTIYGSAQYSMIGGGLLNQIYGDTNNYGASVIGGGYAETINSNSWNSVIGGGSENTIGSNSWASFIGGGLYNAIGNNSDHAVIAGGYGNLAAGIGVFVGGGGYDGTTVSGNQALGKASTIAGGLGNNISGGGTYSFIGGGFGNTIQSNSLYAMIVGGSNNVAGGIGSFAAGTSAQATNSGAFVWADNSTTNSFSSTASNQFFVRATGGIQLVSGSGTGLAMNGQNVTFSNGTTTFVTGSGMGLTIDNDDGLVPGISVSSALYTGHMRFRNAMEIWPNNAGNSGGYLDVRNNIGTQTIWMSGTNGNITCTTLTQTSDRNAKQDFAPVSPAQLLDRVLELPVSEWSYKEDAGPRHIGPMAQDFYSIFKIGADDKHIAPIDEGGVAFAAIQGLNEKAESGIRNAETQIEELRGENAELRARLEALEKIVHAQKQN